VEEFKPVDPPRPDDPGGYPIFILGEKVFLRNMPPG